MRYFRQHRIGLIGAVLVTITGCALGQSVGGPAASATPVPTRTPISTFTATATNTPQPTATVTALPTDTVSPPTVTPPPTDSPVAETAPTTTPTLPPPPPTSTPVPTDTPVPTVTPTPEPVIAYVLAGTNREFNCDYTAIYGTVQDANGKGIPGVTVRALGIHETTGLDFSTQTDEQGRYEIFRIPLPELQAGQWAVMIMLDGQEVSERFHWASTPVCESDDLGHSQVLKVDWKRVE